MKNRNDLKLLIRVYNLKDDDLWMGIFLVIIGILNFLTVLANGYGSTDLIYRFLFCCVSFGLCIVGYKKLKEYNDFVNSKQWRNQRKWIIRKYLREKKKKN